METHERLLEEAKADPILDEATTTYRETLLSRMV